MLVASGGIVVCYDARIMEEYRAVLARPRFGFLPERVDALLDQIECDGELVVAVPLSCQLPDPSDGPFLEVALAARADMLVTGNLRHFPADVASGLPVVSPEEASAGVASERA